MQTRLNAVNTICVEIYLSWSVNIVSLPVNVSKRLTVGSSLDKSECGMLVVKLPGKNSVGKSAYAQK